MAFKGIFYSRILLQKKKSLSWSLSQFTVFSYSCDWTLLLTVL